MKKQPQGRSSVIAGKEKLDLELGILNGSDASVLVEWVMGGMGGIGRIGGIGSRY